MLRALTTGVGISKNNDVGRIDGTASNLSERGSITTRG